MWYNVYIQASSFIFLSVKCELIAECQAISLKGYMYGCLSLCMVKGFLWCITEKDSSGTIRAFQVCLLLCMSSQLGMPEEPLIKLTDQSYGQTGMILLHGVHLQYRDKEGTVTGRWETEGRVLFSHLCNSSRSHCNVITLMMHISKYWIVLLILKAGQTSVWQSFHSPISIVAYSFISSHSLGHFCLCWTVNEFSQPSSDSNSWDISSDELFLWIRPSLFMLWKVFLKASIMAWASFLASSLLSHSTAWQSIW